ncbi:amino acid permease, partial [Candidatus Woesearchaeota archaeon]|nr:amino acid permease [Candidatus Woesearchaeota archaeon]
MSKMKALAEATATLIGTIIGAGIFAIPYVSAKAGFLTALIDIVLIGLLVMLM